MASEDTLFMTLANGLAGFVQFVLLVAFLVVTIVVVRRHRPDAWLPMLGAAITELVGTLIYRVLMSIGPMFMARSSGISHMGGFYAGMALLSTCINVVFWVLLLVGLVRVAKPPQVDIAGAPPYR
jgi:hypothetical protein